MAFYRKVQMKINNKWYPQSTLVGSPVTTAHIAKRLAAESTVAPADVRAVLESLSNVMGDGEEWVFNYTYNQFGKQNSVTYPSGKKFKYHYNSKGFMDRVKDVERNRVIWQANASDRWGNITDFTEGDIQVSYDYDTITGLVNGIVAKRNGQTLLGQACHWTTKGNLQ